MGTASDGGPVDLGRVVTWEPPHRLVWADLLDESGRTESEVSFTADGDGTRVELEHHGLDTLPPDVAGRIRRGYSLLERRPALVRRRPPGGGGAPAARRGTLVHHVCGRDPGPPSEGAGTPGPVRRRCPATPRRSARR
uniref:SRPBCC domain-containing protein n=1 Tax=Nonomuraea pusilla TaxID=46177 RepID=UPI000AE91B8C